MRINRIVIENFRGIRRVDSGVLGDTIIIAGQNGSGKSCIFDAIRLLKSTYGGYQQNEYQHFFGEFQIQLTGSANSLKGLFNDPARPCFVSCEFVLSDSERAYINANAAELLEETIWQKLLPEAFQYGGYRKASFSAQFRDRRPEVNAKIIEILPKLLEGLAQPSIEARITIYADGRFEIVESDLLSVIFTTYRPRKIGVIDFHGAQRHYGRENVQGINLNLEQTTQQYSAHTLYNYNNKYNNVKSEMAGNFVKELLAEKAREPLHSGSDPGETAASESLTDTLKELFESFFPDKRFLGPQATLDGALSFPVETPDGHRHDLDELSSGEKEILYGYLRIRSSAPKDSIILLDEPELHLNPRLIRGLPEFYRKHLGEALGNQMWLVTHSDTLIREAVGRPGFNVFHMTSSTGSEQFESQLQPLDANTDVEMVFADLVGDLAAYRPGGKGLIFEGGGDAEFDKYFVSSVFGEELKGINLVSATNKVRVKLLHEVLEAAYKAGDLPTKFYAVVDKDSDLDDNPAVTRFSWDVYHIENYLLEPDLIAWAMNAVAPGAPYTSQGVRDGLLLAARDVVEQVVIHRLRAEINSEIIRAISWGFSPDGTSIPAAMSGAIERSRAKLESAFNKVDAEYVAGREAAIREDVQSTFSDGRWISDLPGREILTAFASRQQPPVAYKLLRNMIVSRMQEIGFKPLGMKAVIDKVVAN